MEKTMIRQVIGRVSSGRLCTLNQCLAKANFFHFFGLNTVSGNVIDSFAIQRSFSSNASPWR
jgi:hypothetical protein